MNGVKNTIQEQPTSSEACATCGCDGNHNNCWHHGHGSFYGGFFLIRVLLGVVLVLFVFWLGTKIGEVKYMQMRYQVGMYREYPNFCGSPIIQPYPLSDTSATPNMMFSTGSAASSGASTTAPKK